LDYLIQISVIKTQIYTYYFVTREYVQIFGSFICQRNMIPCRKLL